MIITVVEALPLRIPFKAATRSAAAVWGPRGLNVVDSLLVKVTTDDGLKGGANPSDSRKSRWCNGRSRK